MILIKEKDSKYTYVQGRQVGSCWTPQAGGWKAKEEGCQTFFWAQHLSITTKVNIKVTDFLDVAFNLHRPFKKATSNPIYVHKDSNHPMHVKKELPQMIGRKISDLSSNKGVFEAEVAVYSSALKASGYNNELQYTERPSPRRDLGGEMWSGSTRRGMMRKFLSMIDRHFLKGSALGEHCIGKHRSTVKVSYSSMPNMTWIISGHNKKVTGSSTSMETKGCNCRS